MSTIHANSCEDMLFRLEMLCLFSVNLPLPAIRRQIASGVDILVHLGRLKDRSRRVLEIAEVDGMSGDEVQIHSLYRWNDASRQLEKTGELKNRLKLVRSGIGEE